MPLPDPALVSPRIPSLRLALAALLTALLASLALPGAALAEKGLPKPHVSPALDAVLMPVTAEVRREFKLGKKAAGAVVVSLDPGGTGELYGLEPGDVITKLDGKVIRRPVDIDTMVRYSLNKGSTYFFFDGTRKNRKKKTIVEIEPEDYSAAVAVDTLPKWRGYNTGGTRAKGKRGKGGRGEGGYFVTGGGGFFYADFCDAYATDFYEIYDYTLIYVEEIIVTEVFITAYESEETVFWYDESLTGYDWPDEDYITEVDEYVFSEEFYEVYSDTTVTYDDEAYDPETGLSYEEAAEVGTDLSDESSAVYDDTTLAEDAASEDPAASEDTGGAEEPAYDDTTASEEPVYEDSVAEEPVYEEPVAEEPVYEDSVAEEPVYEEPVAEEPVYEEPVYEEPVYEEPVYEEPVYEEPVYEEPVYEEPVYEEPAYDGGDGGGGGCYTDDAGNEVCG